MDINASYLTSKIYDALPDIDRNVLRTISDVLEQQLTDCTITKQTYELATINMNERYLEEYIKHLYITNKSKKTAAQYIRSTKNMLQTINKDAADITWHDLQNYYTHYSYTRKVSARSLCNIERFISPFFRFMLKHDYIKSNPAEVVESPKYRDNEIDPISAEEIERIREYTLYSEYPLRDRAIVEFLLATGCRVAEVENCKITDVDFYSMSVKVFGKGSKNRVVFFNGACSKYLRDYLNQRNDVCDALFLSLNGQPISKHCIEEYFRNVKKETGIKCNPHRFRHTFAQTCVDRGMSVQDLATLMGHESIATTQKYFKNSKANLASAYRRYVA